MPTSLRGALTFLVALWLTLEVLGALVLPPAARGETRADPGFAALEAALHDAVNETRGTHHLVQLERTAVLDRAARAHSEDMAARRYMSHDTPEGLNPVDRIQRAGAEGFTLAAENVGLTTKADPNREILTGWLHSPPHRRNLLMPAFNATGIGIARAADGTYYYTQVYATFPRE